METIIKETMWKQFGASIEMLENAIIACPDTMWDTPSRFWYSAYHCIFYLDYYLTVNPDRFYPPEPFTLSEFEPDGRLPEKVYTQHELLDYIWYCKEKCHQVIGALTEESSRALWTNEYRSYSMFEMLVYNMRHVQHHAARLNLLLRQGIDKAPAWVSQTKTAL